MAETEWLIAELRRYLGWDVPTDLAHAALNHAMAERCGTEYGVTDAGAAWLVKRAAFIVQVRR